MASTVAIKPELIRWAIERSGLPVEELAEKFPHLDKWQNGDKQPTLKQLEAFAKRTMTPFGFLFLAEAPVEEFPLPDFRTKADRSNSGCRPSVAPCRFCYILTRLSRILI
jgi:transcriptional regulator with XRE-family HTH domain